MGPGCNPFRVEGLSCGEPRVARSSQPWAEGRNPFGVALTPALWLPEPATRWVPQVGDRFADRGPANDAGEGEPFAGDFARRVMVLSVGMDGPAKARDSIRCAGGTALSAKGPYLGDVQLNILKREPSSPFFPLLPKAGGEGLFCFCV